MNVTRDLMRKAVSTSMALVMLALTMAVPMMERGELSHETVVESEHDPSRCASRHDHRVCTQVGANLSVASATHQHGSEPALFRTPPPTGLRTAWVEPFLEGPPSRAPPLS